MANCGLLVLCLSGDPRLGIFSLDVTRHHCPAHCMAKFWAKLALQWPYLGGPFFPQNFWTTSVHNIPPTIGTGIRHHRDIPLGRQKHSKFLCRSSFGNTQGIFPLVIHRDPLFLPPENDVATAFILGRGRGTKSWSKYTADQGYVPQERTVVALFVRNSTCAVIFFTSPWAEAATGTEQHSKKPNGPSQKCVPEAVGEWTH